LLEVNKDCQGTLPSIFYASLPSSLVFTPRNYNLDSEIAMKGACLAGGYLTQKLYYKTWRSDIDIFTNNPSFVPPKPILVENYCFLPMPFLTGDDSGTSLISMFKPAKYVEANYDIVVKPCEPYESISKFDISLCQQGIVYDNQGNKTVHVTLLSLYTFYTKNVVITVFPLTEKYEIVRYVIIEGAVERQIIECQLTLKEAFFNHERFVKASAGYSNDIHKGEFHTCETCMNYIAKGNSIYCSGDNVLNRWVKRLCTYSLRFPHHKFIYVLPRLKTI